MHRFSGLNGIAIDLTALGSPTLLTIVSVFAVFLLWGATDTIAARYIARNSVGTAIISLVVKPIIGRQRPQVIPRLIEVTGLSYPSGHSFGATSVYLTLAIVACRYFKHSSTKSAAIICACTLIALVSLWRIYLGVHYPSDVVSGILLGTSWSPLITALFCCKDFSEHNRVMKRITTAASSHQEE